jgi:carbohydrate-selective porin OprB
MTAYPNATWGALLKIKPTDHVYIMSGVYNGDPLIRKIDNNGADFSLDGPVFVINEIGYQLNGLPGESQLLGNYKAGFWYDESSFTDFRIVGPGTNSGTKRGNWGFYGLLGEMFQNQFRGAALSVSGFVQWISNFAITMTFPILLGSFGLGGAYGLYTVFAAISILFVVMLVRETKGKALEEM